MHSRWFTSSKAREIRITYQLSNLSTFQNVALEVSKFEPPVLSEVPSVSGLWLLLVQLLDPQNLGSIIRSAAFFGAAGVLTSIKGGCDFTPTVSKASAGTMETFDSLYRVKSVTKFLQVRKLFPFQILFNCIFRIQKSIVMRGLLEQA